VSLGPEHAGAFLGLSRTPLPVLEQLAELVERGHIDCPLEPAALAAAGLGPHAAPLLAALDGLGPGGVARAARIAIAERVHRPPPLLQLVWTGPEPRASVARDTSLVVRQLFESARASVIVAGYTFDDPHILEPLHAAMRDRAVEATLFLDIAGDAPDVASADALVAKQVDHFFRSVWSFGPPRPTVYYDPRTALRGPPWASLHAKCIVVDDERALVTSANFTRRAQSRNIEVGVLVDDPAFGEELAGQWRALVASGLVKRCSG
jgi:phosphatidylserine/phosphatidylglycerophosphate/cardiolipin synthase-like enzyme